MSARLRLFGVVACLALAPLQARAQGHMLHGFGPVNSAMGGAGTALLEDSLGALSFNPALIAGIEGNQLSFTTEFFKDSGQIDTTLSGGPTGLGQSSRDFVIQPGFGWISRKPDMKLAVGFGLIGMGGFRTDWPEDTASILFGPRPQGFGRTFSDYRVTKIPLALAYRVTEKLYVGASVNVYYAEYAQNPLPQGVADVDATGARWYPAAGNMDGRFALGGQVGFVYQATPKASIGVSITLPQRYQTFKWNSTHVDPASVDYGKARVIQTQLDGPMILSFGAGLKPGPKTQIAVDGMFTKYEGVKGFGSPGGFIDGVIQPLGWRNVWTFKAGVQHRATEKLTLRLGYNYSQTPLRPEVILTAGTASPATFQHRFCGGVGLKAFPFLSAEASFYYAPREHVSGPYPAAQGGTLGTLDTSNQLTSALVGLNFTF